MSDFKKWFTLVGRIMKIIGLIAILFESSSKLLSFYQKEVQKQEKRAEVLERMADIFSAIRITNEAIPQEQRLEDLKDLAIHNNPETVPLIEMPEMSFSFFIIACGAILAGTGELCLAFAEFSKKE